MYTSTFFFHYFIKGNYFCESLFGTLDDKNPSKMGSILQGKHWQILPFFANYSLKSAVFLWL